VGNLKIRQGDEQTQTLVANITENGVPKPFTGLQPFFCAKLGQTAGLGIIEQKVTGTMNPANGTLEYVMQPEDWQQLGRQTAYFSFRKMVNDHEWTEQFSTRDFNYNVTKSVFSEGVKETKKDGSTYIWTIEDMLRLFKEYMASGKVDWENYKNDERTTWEKFVEDNREFLETADPGGKIILELLGARNGAESIGERLDESDAQLAQTEKYVDKAFDGQFGINGLNQNYINALNSEDKITLPLNVPNSSLVMNGGPGAITYFPSIVSYNNELWCAVRVGSDHGGSFNGNIVLRKSTDGITWTYVTIFDTDRDLRDPNLIVAPNGNLVLRYFDATSTYGSARVRARVFNGTSWSSAIEMPRLYGGIGAARGNMTVKDGVIYSANYDQNGIVYIVKSSDSGTSWQLGEAIAEDWKMNEVSLCYNAEDKKMYFVGRTQEYIEGVEPFQDYKNYMTMGESKDGDSWENIKKIPLYGHAPSLTMLKNGKMLLTYKDTQSFSLDLVTMKNGHIFSQNIKIEYANTYDAFYSDVALLNGKAHIIYHNLDTTNIRVYRIDVDELDTLTSFSHKHVPEAQNSTTGYLSFGSTFENVFQEESLSNLTLQSKSAHSLTIPLHRPFKTRPYGANAFIIRPLGDIADLDKVIVYARMINASQVGITLFNISDSSVSIDTNWKLKINAFGG